MRREARVAVALCGAVRAAMPETHVPQSVPVTGTRVFGSGRHRLFWSASPCLDAACCCIGQAGQIGERRGRQSRRRVALENRPTGVHRPDASCPPCRLHSRPRPRHRRKWVTQGAVWRNYPRHRSDESGDRRAWQFDSESTGAFGSRSSKSAFHSV